jgi:hypothetical protein
MRKAIPFLIIFLSVSVAETLAQNSNQPNSPRNCSYVRKPIKTISGGVVMGRAFKIAYPRLNDSAKIFAQNTIVRVKIEIDENGKVISAETDSKTSLLRKVSVQAAQRTSFSPTMVSGAAVRIKGLIIYKFNQGKTDVSYRLEPIKYKFTEADFELQRIFDFEIIEAIADFRVGTSLDSYAFIKNNQANIQLCMTEKTPKIVEKIKQIGFNLLEETQGNGLVGQIAVKNLRKLADIEEIRFIVPEP